MIVSDSNWTIRSADLSAHGEVKSLLSKCRNYPRCYVEKQSCLCLLLSFH